MLQDSEGLFLLLKYKVFDQPDITVRDILWFQTIIPICLHGCSIFVISYPSQTFVTLIRFTS